MDIILWAAQVVLALGFIGAGFNHIRGYDPQTTRPGMAWMGALDATVLRVIGILEVLGAIGVILPAVTRIQPQLTGWAALGLAAVMIGAIVFHARREGERRNIAFNAILLALAAFVAYGRLVLLPFA